MKKQILTLGLIMILSFMTACGNNEVSEHAENYLVDSGEVDDMTEELNNQVKDENSTVGITANDAVRYMESKLAELNFSEIEIDIDYGKDEEFEVRIDRDDDGEEKMEVEIEDDINNILYRDREAFDYIFPKLETLEITSESAELDVIEQILNAFDLSDDYQKIEIEIQFDDGQKMDFEHTK